MRFRLPGPLFLALLGATLVAVLITAPAARAQSKAASDELGYVNPRLVESWFDELPKVEVNLQGTLLKMVAAAARAKRDGDEEEGENSARAAALLERISAIYVRIYEPEDVPMETLEARSADLIDRLRAEGWETIVRVREEDEHVNIQLRSRNEDTVAGLVVLVNETDGESVFVNIVGDISPEDIGQLTGSIGGLSGLGDLGGLGGDDDDDDE
jgi:hypothetical protein